MADLRMLEQVLSDQKYEIERKARKRFVCRPEEKLIDLDSPQAQVLIGVRRCGKSTLCLNALKNAGIKFGYVNFDDERLTEITSSDLNDVLEVLYKINGDFEYLFIDEIQNISEWYLFVNRLLRREMHLVITGSNAKLLSGELATHLTGRHKPITLYPFSFPEFCEWKNVEREGMATQLVAKRRAAFDEYMRQGGFPELLVISDHRAYINSLIDNIVKRDIEHRFRISYKASFEQMLQHLLNVSPCIVADKTLASTFKIKSIHTVQNYMKHMQEAFLVYELQKFSYKSRLRVTSEKVYPIDVAFMNNRENAFAADNLGARLETIVYIELLRRYKPQGLDVFHYADRSSECDFVVCRERKVEMAVQVSYDISNPKTRMREINGLVSAAKNLKASKLLLLTDHEYENIEGAGYKIAIRPTYEYLLTDNDL